ncbi:nicotinate (nicotinamide) nucleotide adenylyltransferase [candidate division KSB1 bacterium]|nr:nicotinate (nicotinamide) nucleotide adenylyltransferase [candidate division KSB1 bacterium]
MRVAIFGGTFDPIHQAHLILAECVREQLDLDRLLFVPSAVSPHKLDRPISHPHHRLEMVRLALQNNPNFGFCSEEIERGGTSFTVDTLDQVRKKYQLDRSNFFLVIGADNLVEFHTWKEPERILRLAQLAVLARTRVEIRKESLLFREYLRIDAPLIEISSSRIRQLVCKGKSIRYLLPDAVIDYIHKHHLYLPDSV